MKKLIRPFFCLLTVLCFSLLAGCQNFGLFAPKQAPSDGKTLTVVTTLSGAEAFRPEAGLSPRADRILDQILALEAEGYVISVKTVSEEDLAESLARASRAGTKYADLIQTNALLLTKHYAAGDLISPATVGLEPSASGTLKGLDGTVFAFRAEGWYHPLPTAAYTVLYNESLLQNLGCETPLELYEDDAWDWINFEKLCQRIGSNASGVYALSLPTLDEPDLIWASLHAFDAVYFKADGTCVMDSQAALDGFAALRRLLTGGSAYPLGSYVNDAAEPTAIKAFAQGKTALYVGNSSAYFDQSEDSPSARMGEDLRILGFPSVHNGLSRTAFSDSDVFIGISSMADLELCKTLLPKLFAPVGDDPKGEIVENYFFHEQDAEIYFELLSTAGTDTSLWMTDNRATVENFFVQVAQGGSAKEILDNLEMIFNNPTKG